MNRRIRKYIFAPIALALCGQMVFGVPMRESRGGPSPYSGVADAIQQPPPLELDITVPSPETDTTGVNLNAPDTGIDPARIAPFPTTAGETPPTPPEIPNRDNIYERRIMPDTTVPPAGRFLPDSYYEVDTVGGLAAMRPDSIATDSVSGPVLLALEPQSSLNSPIDGSAQDSLFYDVKNRMVYFYRKGNVNYENMNLKADFIEVNMNDKNIYAYGITDTLQGVPVATRPELVERGQGYTMDTITYNLGTKKAFVKGTATQEGDGYLIGEQIKMVDNNTINISHGKYTTCDNIEHPHFYLQMSRAKLIPGKKVIIGPTYFVMEDVPIPFLGVPFGFFPLSSGRSSGFIMPSYGEETVKGFFIRDGGYYFAFNDYMDLQLTGGIYTLGSWSLRAQSRYLKRYKYSGSFSVNYAKDKVGEKGAADYVEGNNFSVQWTHRQDPKFRPSSNFSASVNFSSSGYSKYSSTNMNDYLNTQTNSSVAYSKVWTGRNGGTVSLSTNMQHSQNSRDSTITLSFPNVSLSVSRRAPFKRRGANAIGKERWYEKITMSYSGNMSNSINNVKEYDFFKSGMVDKMRNGIRHSIPIQASFNLFSYLNITPSVNYNERWYFRKIERSWDHMENAVKMDTTYGFHRIYDYNFSASMSTKIYGNFQFTGKDPIVREVRHVMTPTVSLTYTPDFSDPKYGYYKPYQSDSTGTVSTYSPYSDNAYGVPGSGASARLSFGISNTLEMKVRSKSDTTGVRKVKVIDNFSINSGYNFLADSMRLSVFSLSLRSTIVKGVGLNVSATLDPYQVNDRGARINRLYWKDGKIGRLSSASTSFGYSFNSGKGNQPAVNDVNSGMYDPTNPNQVEFFNDTNNDLDPVTRRALMTSQYYDFDLPWNISFNYTFRYSNNGIRKDITQTLSFNGSLTLTKKWGVTFNGGYDFEDKKITPGVFTVNRDLHCWQMSFSWVPVGFRKSWSFNIHIKSSVLRDIKYDKSNSYYDNLLD